MFDEKGEGKTVATANKTVLRMQGDNQVHHGVYLRRCYPEEDVYAIWSWGVVLNMTKADLLGEPFSSASELLKAIGNIDLSSETANPSAFNGGIIGSAIISDRVSFATWA